MQHFRKVSSIEEDFAAIGIAKKPAGNFFPSEIPDPITEEKLDEALVVQRTKKMSPADRSKAHRYRQRNKSKIARQTAVRERKPQHQKRQDRVDRLKGDRTAGTRRRFVLQQDMSNMRNEMKALQELRKFHNANSPKDTKQLVETLKRISKNAQTLCRKYAVLEEIKFGQLKESEIPIEHPDSEYGWENPDAPNINPGNKDGDPTDYASSSKLKGNVKAEDDMDPSDNQDWWSDVSGGGDDDMDMSSDDDMDMSADDDMDMDVGSEDDLDAELGGDESSDDSSDDDEMDMDFDLPDDDEDESPMESKRVDLSYEMARLRTEAEDVMQKLKTSVLSPAQAGSFVQDMVIYLGGAMKAYLDLAAQVTKEYQQGGYAGQGGSVEVGTSVPDNDSVKKYAGREQPADAGESPEIYKLSMSK
jgi:hypothetical protein